MGAEYIPPFLNQNRADLKKAVRKLVISIQPTAFATAVFNDYASLDRGRNALKHFHREVDRKLLGKHYYRATPAKRTFFLAFPEHLNSNLHYHLPIRPPKGSLERLLEVAPKIWKKICIKGNLQIELISTERDLRKVSYYVTKDCFMEQNYESFVLSNEWCF